MARKSRSELDKETISKAYARWAPVYDLVFGAVFEHGRHAAIAAAERIGGRILEVGVGTGLSLPYYSPLVRLSGIDISEPMLRKAQQRVTELNLKNVETLAVMDAEHLNFPDASFDVVVAQYVITTVPNPEATLDEFARVLKPGGEIVLVSRVGAEAGLRRIFLRALRALGQQDRQHEASGTPRHAALRPFLAYPLRQGRRNASRASGAPIGARRQLNGRSFIQTSPNLFHVTRDSWNRHNVDDELNVEE
jgi:phosphatidylethanolamine/phosphatidyl-N-methylethanolamine N-methyltransferase